MNEKSKLLIVAEALRRLGFDVRVNTSRKKINVSDFGEMNLEQAIKFLIRQYEAKKN